MKTTAVRTIDDLGRIVLPADIRKHNGWNSQTRLEIVLCDDQSVLIREETPSCCICGSTVNLTPIKTKHICNECLESLR